MRRILVDYARARGRKKRDAERVELTGALTVSRDVGDQVINLNDALLSLEQFDLRKARVVEMRYFAGLTTEEIALVLGISPSTVHLDWKLAKSWLLHEMNQREHSGPSAVGSH